MDSVWCRLCKDLFRVAPAVAWFVTCFAALPFYAHLGWPGPIVCAIFSAIMCGFSIYDIVLYKSPAFAAIFLSRCTGRLADDEQETEHLIMARDPLTKNSARVKVYVASLFTVVSVVFCIVFLAVAYGPIRSEEHHKPCDGICEGCAEDPNCTNWTDLVMELHPASKICPPAHESADTNVTFSCKADGFWMIATSVVSFVWLIVCLQISRRAEHVQANPLATKAPQDQELELADETTINFSDEA